MSTTATANQLGYLGSLIRERARSLHIDDVDAAIRALTDQRITKDGASETIDRLTRMPKDAPVVEAGAPARPARTNSYAGRCDRCGTQVKAGAGSLEGRPGAWITRHFPECPGKDAAPAAGPRKSFDEQVTELLDGIPDGLYAVPSVTGSNDLTFVSFNTNKGVFHPEKKGLRYVRHIVGGNGELANVTVAWITKVAAAVRSVGATEAAIAYGQHVGQCGFCRQSLTRRYSRNLGYGPKCADNNGLPFDHAAYRASEVIDHGKGE